MTIFLIWTLQNCIIFKVYYCFQIQTRDNCQSLLIHFSSFQFLAMSHEIRFVDNLLNNLFFLFYQLNAIIPECETSAEGSAEPEGGNEDLSTIDYNTLNVLREESQTTETQEAAAQEVSEELISTCVTPTRVKTIQRVLAQQDAKRHLCALRLVTHFFTKEELADSNTDGSHDKRGLDSGKLNSLKILVFSKFPASNSEEKAKAWRVIKGKINSKCRVARKSLKLPDSTPRSL